MRRFLKGCLFAMLLTSLGPTQADAQSPVPSGTAGPGGAQSGVGDTGGMPVSVSVPVDGGHGNGGGGGSGASCAYIPRLPKGTGSGDGLSDPGSQNGVPGQYYGANR